MHIRFFFVGLIVCLSSNACSKKEPTATSTTSTTGQQASTSGKLVHHTIKKDECTFDVDAPEALKQVKTSGNMVTYESTQFQFEGFSRSALDSFGFMASLHPAHLVLEKERNPQLIVDKNETPAAPNLAVVGNGIEAAHGRDNGCVFSCSGVASAQADVIAMCKSVKITYKEE